MDCLEEAVSVSASADERHLIPVIIRQSSVQALHLVPRGTGRRSFNAMPFLSPGQLTPAAVKLAEQRPQLPKTPITALANEDASGPVMSSQP